MKKKHMLEADLDPPGTRRTRPGGETAKRALALSRGEHLKRKTANGKTRPGAHAARQTLAQIRRRAGKGK